MIQTPPRPTRNHTLFPDTTLFRSLRTLHALFGRRHRRGEVAIEQRQIDQPRIHPAHRQTLFAIGDIHRRVQVLSRFVEPRSEEHTSALQSLMRISYAVFCLKKKLNFLYHLFFLLSFFILSLL